MVWIGAFAPRDAANLDIEGVSFLQIHRSGFATQGFRNLFARTGKLAFGGGPAFLMQLVRIDFAHKQRTNWPR
jgi:hypothetical protein